MAKKQRMLDIPLKISSQRCIHRNLTQKKMVSNSCSTIGICPPKILRDNVFQPLLICKLCIYRFHKTKQKCSKFLSIRSHLFLSPYMKQVSKGMLVKEAVSNSLGE